MVSTTTATRNIFDLLFLYSAQVVKHIVQPRHDDGEYQKPIRKQN